MAYTNIQQMPGSAGGSSMSVGPGGGGPGYSGGGGDQGMFLEMLAQARADKLRKQREQEALAGREMAVREQGARTSAMGEFDKRLVAERELAGRERGEGQRLALEEAGMRGKLQIGEEQRREMAAQREAKSGFVPTSIITGGPGIVPGRVRDPTKGSIRGQQLYGAQGSSFADPKSAGLGSSAARIMETADEAHERRLAQIRAGAGAGGAGGSAAGG